MMKIFSTQIQGLFNRISEKEEMNIEEGARLLAQAVIGDGTIYIQGFHEMEAITIEATMGAEPLQSSDRLFKSNEMVELTAVDRVLLVSRYSTDPEVIKLAEKLRIEGIPTVGVSAVIASDEPSLEQIVDIHIDTKLVKPLIPDEDGTRYGFPSIMTALFAYYGLAFTIKEIASEY